VPKSQLSMRRSPIVNKGRRFSLLGKALSFASVATHVVLHRVSIRTLCKPSWLGAG
jgi:hypothetical protein